MVKEYLMAIQVPIIRNHAPATTYVYLPHLSPVHHREFLGAGRARPHRLDRRPSAPSARPEESVGFVCLEPNRVREQFPHGCLRELAAGLQPLAHPRRPRSEE